jgi:hypothetical protein
VNSVRPLASVIPPQAGIHGGSTGIQGEPSIIASVLVLLIRTARARHVPFPCPRVRIEPGSRRVPEPWIPTFAGSDRTGRGFGAETQRRAVGHWTGSLDNHSPVPDGPDHPHPLRIWSF